MIRFCGAGLATLVVLTGFSASCAATGTPPLRPAPAASGGSCAFRSTEFAAASSFDQSTSTSFVKLREAGTVAFTQGKAGCVGGAFFANAGSDDVADHVLLQVLLDGAPCAPLFSGYIFANSGQDFSSHSTGFFCGARIAPGKHTIQVQFASGLGGNAEIFQRTLRVDHE